MTNGGIRGAGGGAAARLPGRSFAEVSEPPEAGWIVDAPDSDGDSDEGPDTAFNGGEGGMNDWYDYDPTTHRLSPRDVVFVVRSAQGNFYELQIVDCYDAAGTPANLRFRRARIADGDVILPDAGTGLPSDAGLLDAAPATDAGAEPIPSDAWTVDASRREEFVYVRVGVGVVSVTDPARSAEWDLAFRRRVVRTSSGTSGPGVGGAIDTDVADASTVVTIPKAGWIVDDVRPIPGPPGSGTYSGNAALERFYDYDPRTHAISPRATTFLVRLADGSGGRLRSTGWEDGRLRLAWTYAGPGRTSL